MWPLSCSPSLVINFVILETRAVRIATLKTVLTVLFIAATLAVVPMASANSISFNLSSNNLGISASVGTVTIADAGPNTVSVSINMNAGFSAKLNGGKFAFNGPSDLGLSSVSGLTADGNSDLDFQHFKTTQNVSMFGTFAFDFTNVQGQPKGVVSADNVTFMLTASGLTANQFTGVVIHFCTASGSKCGNNTGYADGTPSSVVPEPGSLALMGTGLLALGGQIRRKLRV